MSVMCLVFKVKILMCFQKKLHLLPIFKLLAYHYLLELCARKKKAAREQVVWEVSWILRRLLETGNIWIHISNKTNQ